MNSHLNGKPLQLLNSHQHRIDLSGLVIVAEPAPLKRILAFSMGESAATRSGGRKNVIRSMWCPRCRAGQPLSKEKSFHKEFRNNTELIPERLSS